MYIHEYTLIDEQESIEKLETVIAVSKNVGGERECVCVYMCWYWVVCVCVGSVCI
jgi:hypothetical protein